MSKEKLTSKEFLLSNGLLQEGFNDFKITFTNGKEWNLGNLLDDYSNIKSSEKDKEIEELKQEIKTLHDYNFQLTEDRDLKAREQDRYTKLYVNALQKYEELKAKL